MASATLEGSAALPAMLAAIVGAEKRGEMFVIKTLTSALAQYCGEPLSRTVTFSTTVKAGE